MTQHSELYTRFAESVEGVDPKWREDLDMDALLALEKEERREAEELLMQRLEENDTRAAQTLAEVKCRGAVMPMKNALPNVKGRMKVAIALALAKLEAGPADPIIAEVIRSGDADGAIPAMSAVRADTTMRSDAIRDALAWACMHHPDPAIRRSAGSILLYASGISDDPFVWNMRHVYLQLGSEDIKTRRTYFEEICSIAQISPKLADS